MARTRFSQYPPPRAMFVIYVFAGLFLVDMFRLATALDRYHGLALAGLVARAAAMFVTAVFLYYGHNWARILALVESFAAVLMLFADLLQRGAPKGSTCLYAGVAFVIMFNLLFDTEVDLFYRKRRQAADRPGGS